MLNVRFDKWKLMHLNDFNVNRDKCVYIASVSYAFSVEAR